MEPESLLPHSQVTIIPLKKPTVAKCSDYYVISFIAHTAKIVARILRRRIARKIEDVLGGDQLRKQGCHSMLRIIEGRFLDVDEKLYACITDWQKASDRVKWSKLMQILVGIDINWREGRLTL
jgi:hypothetical protein